MDLFVVFIHRQRNVAQTQPLQGRAVVSLERDERAAQRRDRMTERFRHAEAVARRAGRGIRNSAGRQNDGRGGILPLLPFDGSNATVFDSDIQRAVAHELDAQAPELALQRGRNVERAVRHRKHALAALDLERHAEPLEKVDGVMPVEAGKRGVQKARILRHVGKQLLAIALVRHVAAALAGDVHLLAEPLVRVEQRYGSALSRGTDGGHHAADDDDLLIHLRPFRKCRSDPTHGRARRTWRRYPRPSCSQQRE